LISFQNQLDKAFYVTQQKLLKFPLDNIQNLGRIFLPVSKKVKPGKEEFEVLNKRFEKLLKQDIQNVEEGLYPRELLFQIPFYSYLRMIPGLSLEVFKMFINIVNNRYKHLPSGVNLESYPEYFRRNYHWQSDGYFSYQSAKLYDIGVELLFLGTADIMRRQIIPPISRFLKNKDKSQIRLLDVACGTARILKQIHITHPEIKLYGLDISPYYVKFAQDFLKNITNVSLINEDAEKMPFQDEYFDIVTCVYLFHELPRSVRKKVLAQMYRVLKPGGLIVFEDSAQLSDSGDIEQVIKRFMTEFHEPYYKDYINNDLVELLTEAGFEVTLSETQYVAKVVAGRKKLSESEFAELENFQN
jgi:ubiquinone/menaquinone biosynthesis C-methylase UbiE